MLPVNYWSWQRSFSELPNRAEFPVAFRATLSLQGTCFPSTVRVDNYSCQSYKISVVLRVDIPYIVTVENRKFLELPKSFNNSFSLHSLS